MLFEGRFEVTLRQLSGEAFPDLSKDGKAYVVGLPGAGYIIELRALPRAFAEASRTIRASVRVDGRSVGVRSSLRQHRATTVAGFLVAEGKHNQEQRFVFAKPSTRGADIAAALQRKDSLAGRISVVFREEGHRRLAAHTPQTRKVDSTLAAKKVEGQKWFQRPSLATAAGELVPSAIVLSANPYEKGRQLCEAHLYVETATVLRLRKVLDDSRPEHRAILQQFMEQVADDDGDCQPAAAPAVAAVQPGAVVKAETGEVPRQQAAAGQPAAAQPGVEVKPEVSKRPRLGRQAKAIDLTGRSPSKQLTVDLT